jgi:transposase-like protein
MMRERGLDVDHSTVFRWVQRYGPEINKRVRPHLRMSHDLVTAFPDMARS